MVSALFHLNNMEAKREQKVNHKKKTLPFCSETKYLGVMLDRSLMYCQHLKSQADITRHTLWEVGGFRLGCWSNNIVNSHLSPGPLNSRVLRSCLVLQCSHPRHWTCHQQCLWVVTGPLCPTPVNNLPILTGIQPAELHHKGATLCLAHCAMEPGYLLHSGFTCPPSGNAWRLKSRHQFLSTAQQLIWQ